MSRLNVSERFWSKVDKTGSCWEWTAAKNNTGYGSFGLGGKVYVAHRVAAYFSGIVDQLGQPDRKSGGHVLHHCDNRACCRPDHLYAGTIADNNSDCISRGRAFRLRGARHPNSKLRPEDVRHIIARVGNGETYTSIAKKLNVSRKTVTNAIYGKTYKIETSRGVA